MGRPLESLKPRTRWLARERRLLGETDSTNRVAEEMARAGAPDGTLVLADRQTAGRGRLGRSFHSPGGVGLYLSCVLRAAALAPEHAHRHVFAAAVAVADTVAALPDLSAPLEIKWPNDVLLDGRKLSGINLAMQLHPRGAIDWLVLGIGVNVNTPRDAFPEELRDLATSLAQIRGRPLDRTDVAERLLEQLEGQIDRLRAGAFAEVLDRWRNYFRMQGRRVRVSLGHPGTAGAAGSPRRLDGAGEAGGMEGEVGGVDEDGALLLHTAAGTQRVVAGDVHLVRGGA